jgi:hypothetical protein
MLGHAARVPSVNAEAATTGEAAVVGSGFPVVVLAAAVLAAEQVSGVLVGSAALWLRGEPVTVGDVDVVIEPEEANLRRLREALCGLTVRPEAVPAVHRLRDVNSRVTNRDCSTGGTGNFIVDEDAGNNTTSSSAVAANNLDSGRTGVWLVYNDAGQHYLQIYTYCSYTISVVQK